MIKMLRPLRRQITIRIGELARTLSTVLSLGLSLMLLLQGFAFVAPVSAQTSVGGEEGGHPPQSQGAGRTYTPGQRPIIVAPPINVQVAAAQEAFAPASKPPSEIRAIHAPNPRPERPAGAVAIAPEIASQNRRQNGKSIQLPPEGVVVSVSPAPSKTFKGEFLSGLTIPPDTMGAVGDNHVVTITNDRMRDRKSVV